MASNDNDKSSLAWLAGRFDNMVATLLCDLVSPSCIANNLNAGTLSGADLGNDNSGNHEDTPTPSDTLRWNMFAASSPYSPLNLRRMSHQPRPLDLAPGERSIFTFEDAFEDLLAVSNGKDLPSLEQKSQMRHLLQSMFPSGEPAIYWVRRLQSQGLINRTNGSFFSAGPLFRLGDFKVLTEDDEEGRQMLQELDDVRRRLWQGVWDNGIKNAWFGDWKPSEWLNEVDDMFSSFFKDVNDGRRRLSPLRERRAVVDAKKDEDVGMYERETEEDHYNAVARVSGSASASSASSTSVEDGTADNSSGMFFRDTFHDKNGDGWSHSWSSADVDKTPRDETKTEETVDAATGIRTVRTTHEKVDKNGNRTVSVVVRRLTPDGEEISKQKSYSNHMSKSWSWSSGKNDDSDDNDKKKGVFDWIWRK